MAPGTERAFGHTAVTREAALAFAREFDPQPFHLDDAAAAASLFGRLSACGWHTCAMAMRMMCDDCLLDSASLGSLGIDELRWLAPVYPGDVLNMRMRVLEALPMTSRAGVGLVNILWQVFKQDQARSAVDARLGHVSAPALRHRGPQRLGLQAHGDGRRRDRRWR